MRRYLFASFFCLSILRSGLVGAPIQPLVGLPSSYTPGQAITFEVHLPAITDLGSYNIDLVLESTIGSAGTDFFFDEAATGPAMADYIFPSSTNFFDAVNVDSATRHRITLTDFDFNGVDVVPGTNDIVATVVIQTALTFSGQLDLFVDTDTLILDTPDVNPTQVPDFDSIRASIAESGAVQLPAVPEPGTSLLALVCGLLPFVFRSTRSTLQ